MVQAVVQMACIPAHLEAALAFQPGAEYANTSRSEEGLPLSPGLLCLSIVLVCTPGTGREMAL